VQSRSSRDRVVASDRRRARSRGFRVRRAVGEARRTEGKRHRAETQSRPAGAQRTEGRGGPHRRRYSGSLG
jgi:hypothetical protein